MNAAEIKAIRAKLGITQVQLAQLMGVHQITVTRWESEADPSEPTDYQKAMLANFGKAAEKNEIGVGVGAMLAAVGVIAVVFYLLSLAFNEKDKKS